MNTNAIRLLSATAIGITVGVVAAVVIPTASSRVTELPFRAPTEPLTIGKANTPPAGSSLTKVIAGSASIVVTRPDPAGGPGWAIRAFSADADHRCVQLGRIVHGKFGWIDGANVFHTTAITDPIGELSNCEDDTKVNGHEPLVFDTTLLDRPEASEPLIRGSVVWGMFGIGTTAAQLHTGTKSLVPARTKRDGAFLEFFGPARSHVDTSAVVHYGQTVVDTASEEYHKAFHAMANIPGSLPIVWSTGAIIARAPDPGGGPSWGVTGYRATNGSSCVGVAGYIVDGRVGSIDAALGLLNEPTPGTSNSGCSTVTQPTRRQPLTITIMGGADTGGTQIDPYRAALRLQTGRTLVWGETLPGVTSITIASSRDVRTVVPSKGRHGFLAVYDGNSGLGTARFIVRFKDGHTQIQTIAAPPG